ncbi:MAG: hypothetical protein JJ975_15915 [Bacteroidia bacterium]|nr:hypothetical protein [Bacteroidia bacterium]
MKKLTIPIFLCIALSYNACKTSLPESTSLAIILDQTDSFAVDLPQDTAALATVVLPNDHKAGCQFRLTTITAYRHSPSYQAELAPVSDKLEYNPYDRKRERLAFVQEVSQLVQEAKGAKPYEQEGSLVFERIHEEITYHINQSFDQSHIIVLGDLHNTSRDWNAYKFHDLLKLSQPDSMLASLERNYPIPAIPTGKKLSISFVFTSTDVHTDQVYDKLVHLLEKYLASKGIEVNICSSFNEINPR